MAIVSIYSYDKTHNSISVSASFTYGGGLAKYYRFYKDGVGDGDLETLVSPVTSTQKYHTYSALSSSTSYNLSVTFFDSNRNSLGSDITTVKTLAPPDTTAPIIQEWFATQIGTNSVTMYVSATDNVAVSGFYFLKNGDNEGSKYSSGSTSYTFEGLSADTSYYLGVKAFDTSDNTSTASTQTIRTAKNRPSNFYWDAGKYQNYSFNITANEWNRLTSTISLFRTYKGLGSYGFSGAYAGNTFTATMFNQAVSAINQMSPPTSAPNSKIRGDTITAADINRLSSSLNSIP